MSIQCPELLHDGLVFKLKRDERQNFYFAATVERSKCFSQTYKTDAVTLSYNNSGRQGRQNAAHPLTLASCCTTAASPHFNLTSSFVRKTG
ncbi:hypothetical protein N7475_007612 [Penicillium sp. IBT 31633x]|nr:hypothetical protein N7475_007612 [Penicillium sp. IBT 31633x]